MMKRLVYIFLLLAVTLSAKAQTSELNQLTDIVLSLRSGGENAFKKAVATLSTDRLWTPMDELGRNNEVECKVADHVPGFKLNAVLTNAENQQRKQVSTGNHLNGADTRYNFSLYEKTLKAGMNATYILRGRRGEQVFIFIPYDAKNSGLEPSITCNGKAFTAQTLNNGIIKLTGTASNSYPLQFRVTNNGGKNASYVLINYNSRK